jgi:hypothetical protein
LQLAISSPDRLRRKRKSKPTNKPAAPEWKRSSVSGTHGLERIFERIFAERFRTFALRVTPSW